MADTSFVSEKATGILICSGFKAGTLYGITPKNAITSNFNPDGSWLSWKAPYVASGFDFTTARNSLATRTNEAGLIETMANDVPRLQYPSCPSVLLEPSRTNSYLYSEQVDNAWWTEVHATITPNAINSPDGDLTADLVTENANSGNHGVTGNVLAINDASQYVVSVFAKYNGRQWLNIAPTFGATVYSAYFDLVNGIVSNNGAADAGIEDYGNGWYRCWITNPTDGTNLFSRFYMREVDGGGAYTGDGVSGQYLWGMMAEEGTYPTTYIKTEAATSNRAIDAGSVSDLIVNGILSASTSTINEKRDGVSYTYRYSGGNKETFIDCISQGSVVEAVPTVWNLTVPSLTEKIIMFPEALTNPEICELN